MNISNTVFVAFLTDCWFFIAKEYGKKTNRILEKRLCRDGDFRQVSCDFSSLIILIHELFREKTFVWVSYNIRSFFHHKNDNCLARKIGPKNEEIVFPRIWLNINSKNSNCVYSLVKWHYIKIYNKLYIQLVC